MALRPDLQIVAEMITPGSKILDIGCDDGRLLAYLDRKKNVRGRGIELSPEGVRICVKKGLSVVQGDADTDLTDYPSQSFDYVILSQTIQATRNPRKVLLEMIRIGTYAIVSLPNFGYWRVRAQLLFTGRMPRTSILRHYWYNTPNIHLCTIKDFLTTCRRHSIRVLVSISPHSWATRLGLRQRRLSNWRHGEAIFLLRADSKERPKQKSPSKGQLHR